MWFSLRLLPHELQLQYASAQQGARGVKLRGRVSPGCTFNGCTFNTGVRVGRSLGGREGGVEPPQVFLLLNAAHGRAQVLLFTFESVRRRAGKSKRHWWWHTQHCWVRVRAPAVSLLPSGSCSRFSSLHPIRDTTVPKERCWDVVPRVSLPGALPFHSLLPHPLGGP